MTTPEFRAPTLVCVLMLAALGCRTPASVAPEPQPAPTPVPAPVFIEQPTAETEATQPPTLASFESFLGLRYGDTVTQMIERHGEPVYSMASGELDTFYYVLIEDTIEDDGPPGPGDDFLFVITTDHASGRIFNLQILAHERQAELDDPLLRFLGAPLSEVVASFGEPPRAESGFHTYEYVDEARNLEIEVEFVCYDFDDWICNELWVTWFEP